MRFGLLGLNLKTVFAYLSQWNKIEDIWFSRNPVHRVSYLHTFGHFRMLGPTGIETATSKTESLDTDHCAR